MPNRIGKISASRSVAYITSFVGEKGMLFYDTTTGNIRISDGVTAGGQPLALSTVSSTIGDFLIASNNITTINPNEDINLVSNGTGGLNISGTLHVHPTSSSLSGIEAFSVNQYGEVKIIDAYANVNTAVLNITGNADGTFVSPTQAGILAQITGQPGTPSRFYNDGNANYALFAGRRYNGSSASPTQVLNGQIIARYGGNGYATGSGFSLFGQARMEYLANDNFDASNQGTIINFYTTPKGTTTPLTVLQLTGTQVITLGDILPSSDNSFSLGSTTRRFKNVYIGPGTLYMTDTTLNTLASIAITNGILQINGIAQAQLPVLLCSTITGLTASSTLNIGQNGDSGTIQLYRGLTFSDSTVQTTAGIPLTQRGAANGVATLDGTGKVPSAQIAITGALIYKGTWNASSNTPTLSASLPAGVAAGWEYAISTTGTRDIGSGSTTYTQGGFVIYNGATWDYVPPATGVTTINGSLTGAVTGIVTTADTGTVTNTMLAGSIANNKLANNSITVTGGTGLGVSGSPVALGGTVTLSNTGVTSIVAGTNVTISGATGAVTINATGAVSSISAGTGIGVSASTGAVTITNTGVTSLIASTYLSVNSGTGAVTISTNATALNTVSTLVARDSSGNFAAGSITASRLILGNRTISGGTTLTVDFSTDAIVLMTNPSGAVTVTLANYTAGTQVTVIVSMATARNIATGVAANVNSSTGSTSINSGAGGTKNNQSVQLVYTCVDGTSAGTYVAIHYQ
jgi:hypothetical protein